MSAIRFQLLEWVETNPGTSAAALADALGYPTEYVRKHLDKCFRRGLLSRQNARYTMTVDGQQRLDYVRANGLVVEYAQ